jgi:PleD family two-component response regulator
MVKYTKGVIIDVTAKRKIAETIREEIKALGIAHSKSEAQVVTMSLGADSNLRFGATYR